MRPKLTGCVLAFNAPNSFAWTSFLHYAFFRVPKRTIFLKTHHNSSKIRLAHYPLPLQVHKGLGISIVQSIWRVKQWFSAWNDFRTTCAQLKTVRIWGILPYGAARRSRNCEIPVRRQADLKGRWVRFGGRRTHRTSARSSILLFSGLSEVQSL